MPPLPNQRHEKKNKGGRPSVYREEFAAQTRKLCALGHTDQEVADFLNVSRNTLDRWRGLYPEFCDALKMGKAPADERVERSLFHRAVGYTFEAEEVFQYQGQIVRAKVRKHVPPDTTAAIFWLKNRRKDLWRDVHRHEVGLPGAFDKLSDEELVELLQAESVALLEDHSNGGNDGTEEGEGQ